MGTTEATLRMENMEVKDEWQDDDFPRPLPEDGDLEGLTDDSIHHGALTAHHLDSVHRKRRTLVAPEINLSLDKSEGSLLSEDFLETPDDLDINVDDIETPDDDSLGSINNGNELEWEAVKVSDGEGQVDDDPCSHIDEEGKNEEEQQEEKRGRAGTRKQTDDTPVASAKGSGGDEGEGAGRLWRTVIVGDQEHRIDMQVIKPYLRVVTHGGYYGEGLNAIIVFAACYLPDSGCTDYSYIMENLFLYVISSLELLVAEDYMIIYLNGATPRRRMPGISWLKRCYQMIERRLRKNLKGLIIAHPSWFIRTVLTISRPFISVKFMDKIRYVQSLEELAQIVPMEHVQIPECVMQYDEERVKAQSDRLEQLAKTSERASSVAEEACP